MIIWSKYGNKKVNDFLGFILQLKFVNFCKIKKRIIQVQVIYVKY